MKAFLKLGDDYFERVAYANYRYAEDFKQMSESLQIVHQWISENNKVIVGGMAIDFALRLKGDKLYDDNTVPDYDIVSPTHSEDAYQLAEILFKLRMKYISAVIAQHRTTMRVRSDLVVVADITYNPPEVYEKVLEYSLNYNDVRIIHPWFQYLDQHRALSFPTERIPGFVSRQRWKKDMERHMMLYKHYPIPEGDPEMMKEIEIPSSTIRNRCLHGYGALCFWIRRALHLNLNPDELDMKMSPEMLIFEEEHIHKLIKNETSLLNSSDIKRSDIILTNSSSIKKTKKINDSSFVKFSVPIKGDDHVVVIDDDDLKPMYYPLTGILPYRREEYIPGDDKKIIIWLLRGLQLSAHPIINDKGDILYSVANLQYIMMYFLYKFIYEDHTSYPYILCRKLVEWGIKNNHMEFAPSASFVYGAENYSEKFVINRMYFPSDKIAGLLPKELFYDRFERQAKKNNEDLNPDDVEIDKSQYIFDYSGSPLFQIHGNKIENSELVL